MPPPPTPIEGESSAPVEFGPSNGFAAALGDLADRLGTSVPSLLGGMVVVLALGALGWIAVFKEDKPPPELDIPYAATADTGPAPAADGGGPALGGSAGDPAPEAPAEVLVHAAGAVRYPGVYALSADARVSDLLAAAGGPLPGADLNRVNLAAPVNDGSRVYVPVVGEEQPPTVVAGQTPATPSGTGGLDPGQAININTATASELETLPGVGPATAAAIVEHRERSGPFASVDGLLEVRGIGEAKLAALRDRVHT